MAQLTDKFVLSLLLSLGGETVAIFWLFVWKDDYSSTVCTPLLTQFGLVHSSIMKYDLRGLQTPHCQ